MSVLDPVLAGILFIVLSLTGSTIYALSGKPPKPPQLGPPRARPQGDTVVRAQDAALGQSQHDGDDSDEAPSFETEDSDENAQRPLQSGPRKDTAALV